MIRFSLVSFLAIATACAPDRTTISGSLDDASTATEVSVDGTELRAPVEAGAFRLEGVEADTVELRFHDGPDEVARMILAGVRGTGELALQRIWLEDGTAFPSSLARKGDEPILVNGLRMAGPLAATIATEGVVLAISDIGDAMIVRPDDAGLPDLKVLLTPASLVRSADGEDYDPDDLESGDSVRIGGSVSGDYVVAREVTIEPATTGLGDGGASSEANDADAAGRPIVEDRDESPTPTFDDDDRAEPKGKGNGGGRGNSQGRGRGRGND